MQSPEVGSFLSHWVAYLASLDVRLLLALNHWFAHSAWAQFSEELLQDLPEVLAPMLVVLWWSWRPTSEKLRLRAVLLLIAQPITYATTTILQHFNHRPRPIIALPLEQYGNHDYSAAINYFSKAGSFPSDHEALLFLLGAFVFTVNRAAGVVCILFGIFYAFLRCGVGFHWPSDMVGGALIAVLIAWVLISNQRRLKLTYRRFRLATLDWAPIVTCGVFVYLADQFNSFAHARDVVRIAFHTNLFH